MNFLKNLMGMGGAKSDSKKAEIRNIFNSKVEVGESYTVLAAMNMVTEKKLLKEIRTYYNYIIGYKDGDDPEIVILCTDHELSEVDTPVYCKKSECSKAECSQHGTFLITHPHFGGKPLEFGIIPSTALGGYIISVSYVDEFTPFMEFFQNRFAKNG
jgi:hypothetical protein